jgi:hypothetical protein
VNLGQAILWKIQSRKDTFLSCRDLYLSRELKHAHVQKITALHMEKLPCLDYSEELAPVVQSYYWGLLEVEALSKYERLS